MDTLRARLLVDLGPILDGWGDPVAVGMGLDGAIYAAARRSNETLRETRGIAEFPKSQLDAATNYLLVRWRAGEMRAAVVLEETIVAHYMQPIGRHLLLVGARCRWGPEGPERNAVAIDWNGKVLRRFSLGDGIEDVRVASDGTIWVSYFDEGVFGNFGWGGPGPRPIGAAGLVGFSGAGDVSFSYDASAAQTDSVCDAYAINVTSQGDVWLYFYTEFPIVRIFEGSYRVWKLGVAGAGALAVRSDRVILFGDYERRNLARIVELGTDGVASVVGERMVVDHRGDALVGASAWGVGSELFFFKDRRVLVADDWG